MEKCIDAIKLAIIGAGAIAEEGYLPAAGSVSNAVVTHIADLDMERAGKVAERWNIPEYVREYFEVFGKVDAVVVATPADSHARISIDCLNHGLHVLCEKPLATSVEEAEQMVETGRRTHTHLAVGMVRRQSWSACLLKKLVATGVLGHISKFDIEEGWEFNWPLRTGHIFQGKKFGGVVSDTGPHLFDLILWILDGQNAQVLSCRDDNWGGIDANAVVEMSVATSSQRINGRIEISFTRKLRNTIKIYGEKGSIEADTVGAYEVRFFPLDWNEKPVVLKPSDPVRRNRYEGFTMQLSNFVHSIIGGLKQYVPADEVVKSIAVIEACGRGRKIMVQPWEAKHLDSFFEGNKHGE